MIEDFLAWFAERYQQGDEPTPAEQADWLVEHPIEDPKEYFYELKRAYEALFGEPFGLNVVGDPSTYEDGCTVMEDCIRDRKPYRVDLPAGAIA